RYSSFFHPYLKTAQVLTDLHGCGPDEIDGAFTDGTANAWRTVAKRLQVPQAKGGLPSPGDIAKAAAKPKSVGVCDSGERAGIAVAALDLLGLTGDDRNWVPVAPERARVLDALAGENELTRYQRRLIAFAADPSLWRNTNDKAELVEEIYAQGIGVEPNSEA